jgi:hypothetical protein
MTGGTAMSNDERSEQIRVKIQSYLKDVAAHLEGMPVGDQHELLRQLESHIHEALRARMGGMEADVSDVEAVLLTMDPPESYGTAREDRYGGMNRGKWALFLSLGTLVVAGLLVLLTGGRMLVWIPSFLFLGGQIAAFVMGILSWRESFGKAAVFTSAGLTAAALLACS